jgi:hypothetical protein
MVVDYSEDGAALYRSTTPDSAARANMKCGAVNVDRGTTPHRRRESIAISTEFTGARDERLLPGRRETAEIMMWMWAIGALSLAAVVNQIAIALCRSAQAATLVVGECAVTPLSPRHNQH